MLSTSSFNFLFAILRLMLGSRIYLSLRIYKFFWILSVCILSCLNIFYLIIVLPSAWMLRPCLSVATFPLLGVLAYSNLKRCNMESKLCSWGITSILLLWVDLGDLNVSVLTLQLNKLRQLSGLLILFFIERVATLIFFFIIFLLLNELINNKQ